jgi:hypothetical protein
MSDIDLEQKFPDMRPVKSAPSLSTVNGCGFCIYGTRDFDEETHTYVKTYCFCFLFVPILALRAYRVADAGPSGWYFVGRVPLSALARMWNGLVVGGILAVIAFACWQGYTHSAGYQARKKLADADRLAAAGQLELAARLYHQVAQGTTDSAVPAMAKLKDLFGAPADQATPEQAAALFKVGAELRQNNNFNVVPGLYDRAVKLAAKHGDKDPRGALKLVDAVQDLAKDRAALAKARRGLLEKAVKKEPNNVELISQLAEAYEALGQRDKCAALLEPFRDRLGITEGARILGQIDARKGKLDQAHALLTPYAEGRLKKLHEAEKQFEEFRTRVLNEVQNGTAPGFPYQRLSQAKGAERVTIFYEYFNSRLKTDPTGRAAQQALDRESKVVGVALDLGMVMLHRAQKMQQPAARKAELEKAEKMFVAIRGVAGQTDQYRLYLGQVYYWLNKPAEGRKLFELFLESKKRDPTMLVAVSGVLREVGATAEARAMAEEAYGKEKDPKKKYQAAIQRALIFKDVDDNIKWLRRCDPADPQVQADLNGALGHKALQKDNDQEAAQHFRDGIAIYERMPENTGKLNNMALLYLALYQATGDRAALDKRLEMQEKALRLKPTDSILLGNTADAVREAALRDIIGAAIDLPALRTLGGMSLLPYLYADEAGQHRYVERVRKHKGVAKAIRHYNRLLVLAPKRAGAYTALSSLYAFTEDLEALRQLQSRLESVQLDLEDYTRQTLERYKGARDEKDRSDLKGSLTRYEKLVASTRKAGGPTFALAADTLAVLKMGGGLLGLKADPDEVVRLAEEAHAAAPSAATHSTLTAALLGRASRSLAKQEREYAALVAEGKRALAPNYLIAVALAREGKLREAVLADKDVRRALELVRERRKKFPRDHDSWSWAVLRASHPEEAAEIAKGIQADEIGRVQRAINLKVNLLSATTVLDAYWASQIAGKEPEGLALLKRCAAQGVPLPKGLLGK